MTVPAGDSKKTNNRDYTLSGIMQSLYFEVCLPIKQELVLLCAFKIMVPQSIYEMIRLFFLKNLNVLNVLKVSSSTLSVNITSR